MATINSINPTTNTKLETYDLMTDEKISVIIDHSDLNYQSYKRTSFAQRASMMMKAADILEENREVYAETITLEMGKTYNGALSEVDKCAWVCRYYAEHAEDFLSDELVKTDAQKSIIKYRPIGVVLAVMPWNYPFWQVFRFAAPALMAGNVGILKHASNVPKSALYIEEVFTKAGFPKYTFTTLLAKSDQVENILKNKKVKAATLTGSGPAGSAVASTAGSNIKHTVLELGGSDPYIILDDADIDHAAEQCKQSRLLNAGQSCIGAKRFIAVSSVYERFLIRFKTLMEESNMGDPMQDVDLGPMARHDLRDEVHAQVVDSVKNGAQLLIGGYIPDDDGAYYPPTILTNVKPGMPAYDEEIFGPVASVIRAEDEADAIRIANDTEFGLGACVFTNDLQKGERIASDELDAGCCFVNQFVKSDPRLPFGGIKSSGYGRELSYYGIREFTNVKTVYIK